VASRFSVDNQKANARAIVATVGIHQLAARGRRNLRLPAQIGRIAKRRNA
jgi:hypothetical protein